MTVAPGGIITIAIPDGTGYGSWAATGERSADATFLVPQNDPEAGFVGYATIRTSIEVAEDGQSFAGTYTIEFPAAMAEAMGLPVGQLGPGEVTGQRIAVEPMGEPVAVPGGSRGVAVLRQRGPRVPPPLSGCNGGLTRADTSHTRVARPALGRTTAVIGRPSPVWTPVSVSLIMPPARSHRGVSMAAR